MIQNNFFIVRHGESENNVLDIESCKFEHKDQFGLTEKGKAQVLKESKKYDQFNIIFTSPFRRARETAEFFAKTSNCEVTEDDRIKEIDLGDFELRDCQEAEEFASKHAEDTPFPNGESLVSAKQRIIDFFEETNEKYQNKNILIVSHGFIIKTILHHIDKHFDWDNYLHQYNKERNVYTISRP